MPGIVYRFLFRGARTPMEWARGHVLRMPWTRVKRVGFNAKRAPLSAPFFLTSRARRIGGLAPDRCPAAFNRRLVAEEHVAVRRRAVALSRRGSLGGARSSSKQGDGSDQGGKNAFHGATPLQRWVRDLVRSMD